MNSRERFLKTFSKESTDRKMRYDTFGFWPETLNKWKFEGLDKSVLSSGSINDYFQADKLDYINLVSGFTTPYYPMFEKKVIDEDEDTITIEDIDGVKKRQIKKDKYLSMPQFLEFPVKNRGDYEEIRDRLMPDTEGRLGMSIGEFAEKYCGRDYPLGMYICGGFAHPRELMGLETYLMNLYDSPEFIHSIMKDWLKLYIDLTTEIIRAVNLDFVYIWEDMCYKSGPLLSPEMYETFIYPYMKELIDSIKSEGVKIIMLDSDGNISKLIDWYIRCGVNVLLPFEVQAGMDIVEVRKKHPDLGIIGGIDKKTLAAGKKEIRYEVMSKVPALYKTGRYIAAIDHSVPPDVSLENYKYYVELLRSLE